MFQSTHPRGVRPVCSARLWAPIGKGFNPRTRVGCDSGRGRWGRSPRLVSIHAPAWGATACCARSCGKFPVSIHAPAWGATWALPRRPRQASSFNPRTRVGCDMPSTDAPPCRLMFQSTHPRGVRPRSPAKQQTGYPVSIHAPTWGATTTFRTPKFAPYQFQSTHPRGVRRLPRCRQTRRGHVSTHAPAWGATSPKRFR